MASVNKKSPTAKKKVVSVKKPAAPAGSGKKAAVVRKAVQKTASKPDMSASVEKAKIKKTLSSARTEKPSTGKPKDLKKALSDKAQKLESTASTNTVSAPNKPDNNRFSGLKNMLVTRRNGILKEAKEEIAKYISGENRQLVDTAIDEADWAAVDISEDISLKRLGAHRQLLLDIEECLRKINEGTYGICEDCGEEISEKRLKVIPTATLCIDCKEIRERMAAFEPETDA